MSEALSKLSDEIAAAVDRGASSIVQVAGHRRPSAGIVFDEDLIITSARAIGDDTVVIRRPNGETAEGHVLGHAIGSGIGVVRVVALGVPPAAAAAEPRVGALAMAIGRTWSGGVMASVTNVAVVGGPLRTGRATEIARVIRIAQSPHAAFVGGALIDAHGAVLGVISGASIRGTTVVVPATLAWDAAHHIVKRGGIRQGFLGISTMPVSLPVHQREADSPSGGLLITSVASDSPAASANVLVGDVVTHFAGEAVAAPEMLFTLLRGDHVGQRVTLAVFRGRERLNLEVTVGERPSRRA